MAIDSRDLADMISTHPQDHSAAHIEEELIAAEAAADADLGEEIGRVPVRLTLAVAAPTLEIGRASCRERV